MVRKKFSLYVSIVKNLKIPGNPWKNLFGLKITGHAESYGRVWVYSSELMLVLPKVDQY